MVGILSLPYGKLRLSRRYRWRGPRVSPIMLKMFRRIILSLSVAACVVACGGGGGDIGTPVLGPTLQKLGISPSTVKGGSGSPTGTVTLSSPAPAGGTTVQLSSSDPTVANPNVTFVTVSQG